MEITAFGWLTGRRTRPFAKTAIKPIGETRNPAQSAVNPLIVKGLMIG
ncbi:MAG: hypothetical protein AAF495_08545 [Pseudomonadota bacterium]